MITPEMKDRLDSIDKTLSVIEGKTVPLLNFARMVAEQHCTVRTKQPCNELPGYEKRLWCIPCRARQTLKEIADD